MLGPPQFVGIINQFIWNNKHVLSEGKAFFQPYFYSVRMVKISALSKDSTFLKSDKMLNCLLPSCFSFVLMGVISTIPSKRRLIMKDKPYYEAPPLARALQISIAGNLVDFSGKSSKMVYNKLRSERQTLSTAEA